MGHPSADAVFPPDQPPASSLPTQPWDALIVGAGPAGCTAGLYLASRGHRVLIMDRARFPREKVCGDGLIGYSLRTVGELGLGEAALGLGCPIREALLISPSGTEVRIQTEIVTLRRSILDTLLIQKAVEAGAVFCQGHAAAISSPQPGEVQVSLHGNDSPLCARAAVIATGSRVDLVRQVGLLECSRPRGVAARCYVRSKRRLDHAIFSNERLLGPGYGWVLPMGDGVYNVGCGISLRPRQTREANLLQAFRQFTTERRHVREIFDQAESVSPIRGWPLRYGLTGTRPIGSGPILVLGEAVGATLPFSGEGIGRAMQTGKIAAEALHDALRSGEWARVRSYEDRLLAEVAPLERSYQTIENLVTRAWVTELGAWIARRSALVRDVTSRIVRDELDPWRLLSLGKMVRYLRSRH